MFPPNFGLQYHITYYAPSLPYTGDPKAPNAIDLKEGVNIFSFFFKKKITSTQLTLSGRGNRNTGTPRISVGYRRCEVRLRGNKKTKKNWIAMYAYGSCCAFLFLPNPVRYSNVLVSLRPKRYFLAIDSQKGEDTPVCMNGPFWGSRPAIARVPCVCTCTCCG